MPKGVVFSLLFLTGLLDLQRRASKRLHEARSPVKSAASESLDTSPPARRQSRGKVAQMPQGAQRGSKSKFVTGGSARRSMSGSDGMRTMYGYWLTPHPAEPPATAKLAQLGLPPDWLCARGQSARKAWSVQCKAKKCHLAFSTCVPCMALQQANGLVHLARHLSHTFASYINA